MILLTINYSEDSRIIKGFITYGVNDFFVIHYTSLLYKFIINIILINVENIDPALIGIKWFNFLLSTSLILIHLLFYFEVNICSCGATREYTTLEIKLLLIKLINLINTLWIIFQLFIIISYSATLSIILTSIQLLNISAVKHLTHVLFIFPWVIIWNTHILVKFGCQSYHTSLILYLTDKVFNIRVCQN